MRYISLILILFACTCCCNKRTAADITINVNCDSIVSTGYLGNGVEWDPYQLDYGFGRVELSEEDWQKLFSRLDNMKPQFIRMMFNTHRAVKNGKLDTEYDLPQVKRILSYCQKNDITVLIGDWGGHTVDVKTKSINKEVLSAAAEYAKFLVEDCGYSCIKYYNIINEPNGDWSSNKGDYKLWADAFGYFASELKEKGISKKIGLVGPDAAIWDVGDARWVDSCTTNFKETVKLYDIHTYPTKSVVNSGRYSTIIKEYKNRVPEGMKIIMGEIGLKFIQADSLLGKENDRRISLVDHASRTDSQMFVFDHSYGVLVTDALFQTMNQGFSGALIWMLDDAMHSNEAPDKLKIWGFWNILGEEYFGGEEQEKVRPFYYVWSLMSKYIPKGSTVYEVNVSDDSKVRAIAVENNGAYTIAAVNVSDTTQTISFGSSTLANLKDLREYRYVESEIIKEGDCQQLPNSINPSVDMKKGLFTTLPKESVVVFTNMK